MDFAKELGLQVKNHTGSGASLEPESCAGPDKRFDAAALRGTEAACKVKAERKPANLDAILRRSDVWRGDSRRFSSQDTLKSGFESLDKLLLHKGWPLGALIEVCQPLSCGYSEWQLLAPSLCQIPSGYIVLLNPPALPFSQGILQMGLDLNRLLIIQTPDKASFIKSFIELGRSPMCAALMAWQLAFQLSYTDLRKCLLSLCNRNLTVFFRHNSVLQQSSPASLRLAVQRSEQGLDVEVFKQRGTLLKMRPQAHLSLPQYLPALEKQETPPQASVSSLLDRL